MSEGEGTITLVRLSPAQYQRSIQDVFGKSVVVEDSVEDLGERLDGLLAVGARKLTLSAAEVERYEALALQVAAEVTDPARRATLIHCEPKALDAPDDDCASRVPGECGAFLVPPAVDERRVAVLRSHCGSGEPSPR